MDKCLLLLGQKRFGCSHHISAAREKCSQILTRLEGFQKVGSGFRHACVQAVAPPQPKPDSRRPLTCLLPTPLIRKAEQIPALEGSSQGGCSNRCARGSVQEAQPWPWSSVWVLHNRLCVERGEPAWQRLRVSAV